MEGAGDRREQRDSREAPDGGLDDYRVELAKKYREPAGEEGKKEQADIRERSNDDGGRRVGTDPERGERPAGSENQNPHRYEGDGEATGRVSQPREQRERTSKAVHKDESPRSDEPRDTESSRGRASSAGRAGPSEGQPSENGGTDRAGSAAGSPESRSENSGGEELERFRKDVRDKYPESEHSGRQNEGSIEEERKSLQRGNPADEKAGPAQFSERGEKPMDPDEERRTAAPGIDGRGAGQEVHEPREVPQGRNQEENEGPPVKAGGGTRIDGDSRSHDRPERGPFATADGPEPRTEREGHREIGRAEGDGGNQSAKVEDSRSGVVAIEEDGHSSQDRNRASETAESVRSLGTEAPPPPMHSGSPESKAQETVVNDQVEQNQSVPAERDPSRSLDSRESVNTHQKAESNDGKGHAKIDAAEVRLRESSTTNRPSEQAEPHTDLGSKAKPASEEGVARLEQVKEPPGAKGSVDSEPDKLPARAMGVKSENKESELEPSLSDDKVQKIAAIDESASSSAQEGRHETLDPETAVSQGRAANPRETNGTESGANPELGELQSQHELRGGRPESRMDRGQDRSEKPELQTIQAKLDSDSAARHEARPDAAEQRPLAVFPRTIYTVDNPDHKLRWDMHIPTFKARTGVTLGEGKIHHIKGTIDGKYDFEARHFKGKRLVVTVPKEYTDKLTPGKHMVVIHSVEEKRQFVAFPRGSDRTIIALRKSAVESLAIGNVERGRAIIEMEMRNRSKPNDPPVKIFAHIAEYNGGVRLYMKKFGARERDAYEMTRAERLSVKDFIGRFNAQKSEEFKNVRLELEGNRLGIQVDENKFPFKEYRLCTSDSKALLRTRLDFYKMELRFWYDGEKFRARFGVYPITEFRIRNGKPKFEHSANPSLVAQRVTHFESMRTRNTERLHEVALMERINLTSRPEGIDGRYAFEVTQELRDYVKKKLEGASTLRKFTTLKGTLGERMAPFIIRDDWDLIAEHPDVKMPKTLSCHRPGPDLLMGLKTTKEFNYFEVKWYDNVAQALASGSKDARKHLREKRKSNKYGKIVGAYVAALDWNPEEMDGNLHVKRAK